MNKWRFDFAAALAAGLIILFLGALMGQSMYLAGWPDKGLEYWMERYQTVVVSLVAVVGLVGVSNQIKATQKQTRAALTTNHKTELGAFALAHGLYGQLVQHIQLAIHIIESGRVLTHSTLPVVSGKDLSDIRQALNMAGTDPFGLNSWHQQWQGAFYQCINNDLTNADLKIFAEYMLVVCTEQMDTIERSVEALHAQIDASV